MLFRSRFFTGISFRKQKKRLAYFLFLFAIALSIPLIFLVKIGFEQFQENVLSLHHWNGRQALRQTASDYLLHVRAENNRAIDDYQFFKTPSNQNLSEQGTTLSPLAAKPEELSIPGLVSYFQVDNLGTLSNPLLPFNEYSQAAYQSVSHLLSETDVAERLKLNKKIKPMLIEQGLLPSETITTSIDTFIEDEKNKNEGDDTVSRFVFSNDSKNTSRPIEVKKISAFMARRTSNAHIIFFRNIWDNDRKLTQGFIVDEPRFLFQMLMQHFSEREFTEDVLLQLSHGESVVMNALHEINSLGEREITQLNMDLQEKSVRIYFGRLPAPLGSYSLTFSMSKLPIGQGTKTGAIFLAVVVLIIITGLITFHRLGIQQINLNEERLNFVSSVSHELKTPLTSIIMYADMLRSDMLTDKNKQHEYYNYIFFEGERLGRLIGNVLRLSKLGQDSTDICPEYVSLDTAIELIKAKTLNVLEKNNFKLNIHIGEDVPKNCSIYIDFDAFTQVIINLVDNGVKFTSEYLGRANTKPTPYSRQIDINISRDLDDSSKLSLGVRDYGPGVESDDKKHIFKSFYRAGNELTRKTKGAGMGLALVTELVNEMEGDVAFLARTPGSEFVINLLFRAEKPS